MPAANMTTGALESNGNLNAGWLMILNLNWVPGTRLVRNEEQAPRRICPLGRRCLWRPTHRASSSGVEAGKDATLQHNGKTLKAAAARHSVTTYVRQCYI